MFSLKVSIFRGFYIYESVFIAFSLQNIFKIQLFLKKEQIFFNFLPGFANFSYILPGFIGSLKWKNIYPWLLLVALAGT